MDENKRIEVDINKQKNFHKKFQKDLTHDIAIVLLDVYPKQMKTDNQSDIWSPVFIVALFTTGRISACQWMNG